MCKIFKFVLHVNMKLVFKYINYIHTHGNTRIVFVNSFIFQTGKLRTSGRTYLTHHHPEAGELLQRIKLPSLGFPFLNYDYLTLSESYNYGPHANMLFPPALPNIQTTFQEVISRCGSQSQPT